MIKTNLNNTTKLFNSRNEELNLSPQNSQQYHDIRNVISNMAAIARVAFYLQMERKWIISPQRLRYIGSPLYITQQVDFKWERFLIWPCLSQLNHVICLSLVGEFLINGRPRQGGWSPLLSMVVVLARGRGDIGVCLGVGCFGTKRKRKKRFGGYSTEAKYT